ncbi:hypothetical protein RHECNPAF_3500025 [Rhizobium etli CNPAF512]|nr:hypothetical protein RHECNPAF_3500025 [Rhizobium etli CNPAF512]
MPFAFSACAFDPLAYVILRMCFRAAAPDSPLGNSSLPFQACCGTKRGSTK